MTRSLSFSMSIRLIAVSIFPCVLVFTEAIFNDISPYELIHGDLHFEFFTLPLNLSKINKSRVFSRRSSYPNTTVDLMEMLEAKDLSNSFDINDFNGITRSLNLTRRYRYHKYGYSEGFKDKQDYYDTHVTEQKKRNMLVNINLQFLMHARYYIIPALKRRGIFRKDKRYKLGYLFNRMRRLMTEQRKVVTLARMQFESKHTVHEDLQSTMVMYERVVRLDVDLRDTAARIKEVYGEYSIIDNVR